MKRMILIAAAGVLALTALSQTQARRPKSRTGQGRPDHPPLDQIATRPAGRSSFRASGRRRWP